MIPEVCITCHIDNHHRKHYECNTVSVKAFRAYCDLMEKNISGNERENVYFSMRILQEFYPERPSLTELRQVDMRHLVKAVQMVHFIMQEIVVKKFNELSDESPVEVEKSAFDDYDKENGYEEENEETSAWKTLKDSTDRIIKIGTRILNTGYNECLQTNILTLLEYVKFELDTVDENQT